MKTGHRATLHSTSSSSSFSPIPICPVSLPNILPTRILCETAHTHQRRLRATLLSLFLTTLSLKMNIFLAMLMAVFAVTAAPTSPASAAKVFKASTINAIMENMCFDMSTALCGVGHKVQYGVYDPATTNGICTCSDKPSTYVVGACRYDPC